ncbi:hypothetical protein COCOR_04734 [Corallococcus coralloides DSM 2259]|uniref:Lipoprotein n=1 Tax=Corallococcus coralloides (strain ATCC 25202 / DSM 2259 / NBRC 100086 / M2) TaxID=1144275 RepID=H8MKQ4_CORCM|nr:hypothetical protein [Corallococcus coralloides]AFE05995.1 hypothetical protein COCOR_04734 [Corallococcus coralloides DSM 2259]
MQRALFFGSLLGAALLNAGCQESSNNPAASTFTPRPTYETREPEGLTSRLTGFTVDPEAYFFNLAGCAPTPEQCQLPPLYAEFSPLLQRAVVQNAPISLLDSATGQVLAEGGVVTASDANGVWTLDKAPTRRGAPFFVLSLGGAQGTLPNNGIMPLPPPMLTLQPVPAGNYVPTLTVRPVVPAHSACVGLEALQMSDKGILEAVAKYLTATEGTPTTVADLLNPGRFGGVTVFWLYRPGFPVFRVPAANTTVEASAGRVLNIEWAPVGVLPPPLAPFQSTRGFFIPPGPPAPNSSLGLVAVVHPPLPQPPMGPPPVVHYEAKDSTTSDPEGRPWVLQPLDLPVAPGSVTFAGLQMYSKTPSTTPQIPPPSTCLPGQ